MARRNQILIDGEVHNVPDATRLDEIVAPEVTSVVTNNGEVIPRSEFDRAPVPQGFETNLSHINKG